MIPQKDIHEMKSLQRELEDIQDNLLEIRIESALLDKEDEATKELLENEKRRNVQLKKQVQEMSQIADEEKNKSDSLMRIWRTLNNGTLTKIENFAEDALKDLKETNQLKKANLDQKLSEEIDNYVKTRSTTVKYCRQDELKLAEDERSAARNSEELKRLLSESRAALDMSDAMFQLTVVEIASLVLRYQDLMRQLNNQEPDRTTYGNQMRMLMPMQLSRLSSPPVSSGAGRMMSEMASSSKCQDKLDTDENLEGMSRESSVPHPSTTDNAALKSKKSVAFSCDSPNTIPCDGTYIAKPSKTLKGPQNARDDDKDKNAEVVAEQFKRPLPTTGSFKRKQSKKSKGKFVHFESGSGSGFEMDSSKDERVSSSDFHMASGNEVDEEIPPANENQMLLDDGEISPFNENEAQMSVDDEMNAEMDDQEKNFQFEEFDDDISNWSSLDPNRMSPEGSPTLSGYGGTFEEPNGTGDNNTKTTGNSDFMFDSEDDNVSDFFH